jgi:hypothetical protein
MNRRPWINRYGTVAVLAILLVVLNPELRAFLLLANFVGLDLIILLIVIQLRQMVPTILSYAHAYPMRSFLCVAGYSALRVATRTVGLLLAPGAHETAGATTLLFVLSKNLWCPNRMRDFT